MSDMHVELRMQPGPAAVGMGGDKLMSALRRATATLAPLLATRVRGRTPRQTGALREDVTGDAYTSAVSGTRQVKLVDLYVESGAQVSEWGRVYAAYQEGPPLGLSTYTNGPHQMFARVATEDLGLIEGWAEAAVGGADVLEGGEEVTIP